MPLLYACAPQIVYRDRVVSNPVPVPVPLADTLTVDCPPDFTFSAGPHLVVADVLHRLDSVESALAICRSQLDQIRTAEAKAIGDAKTPAN